MRTPTHSSDHTTDILDLRVEYHNGTDPVIDTAFAEDIRYWSDRTEEPIGDDRIFLRRPQTATTVPVETADDVGLGRLLLPDQWLEQLGIIRTPVEVEFLMVEPSYTSQLERFY